LIEVNVIKLAAITFPRFLMPTTAKESAIMQFEALVKTDAVVMLAPHSYYCSCQMCYCCSCPFSL